MRVGESRERAENGCARPDVVAEGWIVGSRQSLVTVDEAHELPELSGRSGTFDGQPQISRGRGRSLESSDRLVLKPARATRFTGHGLGGERFQPVPPAEILDFVKPPVEGRHAGVVDGRFIRRVDRECPVRGAEQVDQRAARGLRHRDLEDEVERGRKRLGGERTGVERLIRNMGLREHAPREIDVRERSLEDERRALRDPGPLDGARKVRELFLPIACDEPPGLWLAARALRNHEHGGGRGASETRFFDPGKGVVQALVKAGGEQLLSRQDLDPRDAVDPREEIAVRGP